jgi:hypothetical protein
VAAVILQAKYERGNAKKSQVFYIPVIPHEVGKAVWLPRTESRFLDSAGSSAFADNPATLEMTTGK